MVLPQGQVFFGPLYGLLLLMFMGVLYLMGGTVLQGFETTKAITFVRVVCDVAYFPIIGNLLANLN